jgi:hypothetical protein
MADNLKPYNPNKGFISFRLNPDALKEEALNLIPWPVGTIAREMHRNPDGSIVETAKQVGRETPVLGSLLAGEPVDAAKEAVLFGFPVKAPAKSKARINKLPSDTQFKFGTGLFSTDRAYSPSTGKSWRLIRGGDGQLRPIEDLNYNPNNFVVDKSPSYNAAQVNEFIDNSNALEKLNKNGKLEFDKRKFEELNPYELDRLDDPKFTNTIEGKLLKEGKDVYDQYYKPIDHSLNSRVETRNEANSVSKFLNEDESLIIDRYDNLYIKDNQGRYWRFDVDQSGNLDKWRANKKEVGMTKPYSDPTLDADLNQFKAKAKEYNAKWQNEDTFMNFKEADDWFNDVDNASDAYYNSIHGPFYEDILSRRRF